MSDLERSKTALSAITEARLTLGARHRASDTRTALTFALDHARARDAVLSELDVPRLSKALAASDLTADSVTSAAGTRDTFIRRPDLGRVLPEEARSHLAAHGPVDVALVLADGLSAVAVALNGPTFIAALAAKLKDHGLSTGPVVCARQARVALGDPIAQAMQAQTVVVALGERPGLSASDSLGVYITHQPTDQTQDSARNCISNIREAGTDPSVAARQALALILDMRKTGLSGVALSQARAAKAIEGDGPQKALPDA